MSSPFEVFNRAVKFYADPVLCRLQEDARQGAQSISDGARSVVDQASKGAVEVDRTVHTYVDPVANRLHKEAEAAKKTVHDYVDPAAAIVLQDAAAKGAQFTHKVVPVMNLVRNDAQVAAVRAYQYIDPLSGQVRGGITSANDYMHKYTDPIAGRLVGNLYGLTRNVIAGHAAISKAAGEKIEDAFDYVPPLKVEQTVIKVASMIPGNQNDAHQYEKAKPGYNLQFPKDEAAHDAFKSEWWYYVGHLKDDEGHKYGYELTFFRHKLLGQNMYFSHLALSDEQNQNFQWKERSSVLHPFTAGAKASNYYVWNGDWKVSAQPDGSHKINAGTREFSIQLNLDTLGAPVAHGDNGFSRKADGDGKASYYYSRTKMPTEGLITDHGKVHHVRGNSWMDHEFGSNMLGDKTIGWNWYSVQLENDSQLMLCIIRNEDGTVDNNSFGTIIGADGQTRKLTGSDFIIKTTGEWQSPKTNTKFPMGWDVTIPSEEIRLNIQPSLKNQELETERSAGLSYWEGKCSVSGSMRGKSVKGDSYVELTGYAQKINKFLDAMKP